MISRAGELRSVRDLGARAKRVLAFFGGAPRDAKDRGDDDDDLPRPNAVSTRFFTARAFALA